MAFEIPSDPTSLTFAEYSALDMEERVALVDAVYEKYQDKIETIVGVGGSAVWTLVCGPECEVVQTAADFSEALTDDQIWERAAEIGYAPYHYFREEIVEDLAIA